MSVRLMVEENTGLIRQGIDTLSVLDPKLYRSPGDVPLSSSVGKHFRHVLDFYDRLLDGYSTVVDYDARGRDPRVETDPEYAASVARRTCAGLNALAATFGSAPGPTPVVVRTEIHSDDGSAVEVNSTIERELSALSSHTVHHYAIIALVLRLCGWTVGEKFGVAPSTLRYLAQKGG